MLTWLRAPLRALLDEAECARPPMLRRAARPDRLFCTDLPLAAGETETGRFLERCKERGIPAERNGDLILLDPLPGCVPGPVPEGPVPGEAGCLCLLLALHPGEGTDPGLLRRLLKAADTSPAAYNRLCRELHRDWAARLRLHLTLPGDIDPWITLLAHETEA